MKYSEIRNKYQHHRYSEMVFVDPYAQLLSPFMTKLCLKIGMIPNAVTVLMMIFGIIGAILFALPSLACKIAGTVFIHLWYIADCSDGEVARITKRFSLFGTEIDYTAHVINHPLFILSFAISLISRGSLVPFLFVCAAAFLLAVLDLIFRIFVIFDDIYFSRTDSPAAGSSDAVKVSRVKKVILYFINIFIQLPNFCLIFPIIYFINSYAAFIYMAVTAVFCAAAVIYHAAGWIVRIIRR